MTDSIFCTNDERSIEVRGRLTGACLPAVTAADTQHSLAGFTIVFAPSGRAGA